METLFIILIVIGIPALIIRNGIKVLKNAKIYKFQFQQEYNLIDKVNTGTLVAGHPDVNDKVTPTAIFCKEDKLHIFCFFDNFLKAPNKIAEIGKNQVSNITIEDQSTLEKRITATRLLLVGVFAFAWKKKKKNYLAYMTINWNDGKFDHETIFMYEGATAMKSANESRNKLIKLLQ